LDAFSEDFDPLVAGTNGIANANATAVVGIVTGRGYWAHFEYGEPRASVHVTLGLNIRLETGALVMATAQLDLGQIAIASNNLSELNKEENAETNDLSPDGSSSTG